MAMEFFFISYIFNYVLFNFYLLDNLTFLSIVIKFNNCLVEIKKKLYLYLSK